jgi:hypothetical protein
MLRFPGFCTTVLLIGSVGASATEVGDWVVIVRPVDLKPRHGSGTKLTPGTCVRVLELNTQSAYVSVGRVGNVERTAWMPIEEGLDRFSKAITNDPKDASAWFARAKIFFHQREMDKAIADLDRGLMLSRDNSEAYAIRGFAWKGKGDNGRAMTDLNRAIELDPRNALAQADCDHFGPLSAVFSMATAMVQEGVSLVGGVTLTSVIRYRPLFPKIAFPP